MEVTWSGLTASEHLKRFFGKKKKVIEDKSVPGLAKIKEFLAIINRHSAEWKFEPWHRIEAREKGWVLCFFLKVERYADRETKYPIRMEHVIPYPISTRPYPPIPTEIINVEEHLFLNRVYETIVLYFMFSKSNVIDENYRVYGRDYFIPY